MKLADLAAGIGHWEFGTFDLDRVNPPLVRMYRRAAAARGGGRGRLARRPPDDPFGRPEFPLGRNRARSTGSGRSGSLRWPARGVSRSAWLGSWICFSRREPYGDVSGLVALGCGAFARTFSLGERRSAPTCRAAATGPWAAYAYWQWLQTPGWRTLLMAAAATGVALLTKSTWIILFGLWPAVWLAWRWRECNGVGNAHTGGFTPPAQESTASTHSSLLHRRQAGRACSLQSGALP